MNVPHEVREIGIKLYVVVVSGMRAWHEHHILNSPKTRKFINVSKSVTLFESCILSKWEYDDVSCLRGTEYLKEKATKSS